MPSGSLVDVLKKAAEDLSRPFEATVDVRTVSIVLDAIAGNLVKSPHVASAVGPERAAEFAASSPDLPTVLRQIGGADSERAAAYADQLLAVSRSSLIDIGTAGQDVTVANAARERLHDAFTNLIAHREGKE